MTLFGIRSKLFFSFMLISILGIAGLGVGGFYITKGYLQQEAFDQLTALREVKQQQIEAFFGQARDQVDVFSQDLMIVDAMREFKKDFFTVEQEDQFTPEQLKKMMEKLKKFYREDFLPKLNANLDEKMRVEEFFEDMKNSTIILQNLYIVDNPYPDKRIDYDRAPDKSNYTKTHAKYNPIIREYLSKFAYYDLFLIDSETGYVVYNASKEVDFAANITKGAFEKTNLGEAFFEMQESTSKDFVKFIDFKYYAPSQGMPSGFVMAPIYEGDKKIGVLALQIDLAEINKIMTNDKKWKQTGLGTSGESYIIGDDYKMRSDSRFLIENPDQYFKDLVAIEIDKNIIEKMRLLNTTILIQEILTESGQEVMRGNSDTRIITDYRGVPNISSYTPLNIEDAQWGILAEMDYEELLTTVREFAWKLFGIALATLCCILVISFILMRLLVRPLYRMASGLKLVNRENHLNLRERLSVEGSDIIAQLNGQMNEILSRMQKGMQAILKAKKEMASQAGKAEERVQQSSASAQAVTHTEEQEKEQIKQAITSLEEVKASIEKVPAGSPEQKKELQKALLDLSEQLMGLLALGSSALSDSKKVKKALAEIDEKMKKIKEAIAEFENTARGFTI